MVEECSKFKGLNSFFDFLIFFIELGFVKLVVVKSKEKSYQKDGILQLSVVKEEMEIEMCKLQVFQGIGNLFISLFWEIQIKY